MSQEFEVAVVGASLAGLAAAIKLGADGIDVALVDKDHHPRRKACGEGLSGIGTHALDLLGARPQLRLSERSPLEGYAVYSNSGRTVIDLETASDRPSMGISREILDSSLFATTAEFGSVQPLLGHSVRAVTRERARWKIETDESAFCARQLLIATGTNSKLLSQLGIPITNAADSRFGLTYHCTLDGLHELRCVSIILGDGFEVFCTPLGSSLLNVSVIGSKEALRPFARTEGEALLFASVEEHIGVSIIDRSDALGSGPFGRNATRAFGDGLLLAGDTLESFDPIGGMGMTHALLSGMLAGDALSLTAKDRSKAERSYLEYASSRAAMARPFRGFTRMTKYLLTRLGHTTTFKHLGSSTVSKRFARTVHEGERNGAASLLLQIIGWR